MSHVKRIYTEEERKELQQNPYTASVSPMGKIKFTLAFKQFALEQHQKGTRTKDIFKMAGYRPELFEACTMRTRISRILREAASPEGLRESRTGARSAKRSVDTMQTRTAIRHLENQVQYLEEQMEFLKKLIELDRQNGSMK